MNATEIFALELLLAAGWVGAAACGVGAIVWLVSAAIA